MKNMKYSSAMLAYVLIVALFFAAGYGVGTVNGKNQAREVISSSVKEEEAIDAAVTTEEEVPEYELVLEDGHLTIYENGVDEKSIIARCEISESVFPREDIITLREGLLFSDKTDAMAMFESFAS